MAKRKLTEPVIRTTNDGLNQIRTTTAALDQRPMDGCPICWRNGGKGTPYGGGNWIQCFKCNKCGMSWQEVL